MNSYPQPLHELPGFGVRGQGASADFPGATALSEGLLTVPVHSRLTGGDLRRLEEWLAT